MLKKLLVVALAVGFLATQIAIQAPAALACGALVAPNGSVRLARATTLVAWHNGIEHYLSSFSYQGDVSDVGWIIPLPAVPISIVEGGAWTLQRLELETHPVTPTFGVADHAATAASATVLQQVKIAALNITVIRGSGPEIVTWATSNGFTLPDEIRAHLLVYAHGSPIFLAAKYDTSRAQAQHLLQGDGTPILITMRTTHIWVPLEVLAYGDQLVQADLFLLTDTPVYTSDVAAEFGQSSVNSQVPNAPGFELAFQEKMTPALYHDLSTDRNMSWVPANSWLTYLTLNATEPSVTYDLGVSSRGVIHLAPFGTAPMAVAADQASTLPTWLPELPMGAPQVALVIILLIGAVGAFLWLTSDHRRQRRRLARASAQPPVVD
jgi:hypothetical protein